MAFTLTPFGRVSPSRAIDKPAVAFLPATAGALASIGAGAGKIADWDLARIEGGQPVPRFGSVVRSPHTGRGSDGRPVQFLDTCAVPAAAAFARLQVVAEFVRARLAGLPGLARIAVQRVGAALAGAVRQEIKLFCLLCHVHEIGMERARWTERGFPPAENSTLRGAQ